MRARLAALLRRCADRLAPTPDWVTDPMLTSEQKMFHFNYLDPEQTHGPQWTVIETPTTWAGGINSSFTIRP